METNVQPYQAPAIAIPEHLEPYRGWINLAEKKNQLLHTLKLDELAAQVALRDVDAATGHPLSITDREEAAKAYRSIQVGMVEKRRSFTGYIEGQLFAQVMEPEKRLDPKTSQRYVEYVQTTLNMRLAEEEKLRGTQEIQSELVNFEAYIKNEYTRIATEYRVRCHNEIANVYQGCLTANMEPGNALAVTRDLKQTILGFELSQIAKFTRVKSSPEQLNTIWSRTPQPNLSYMQEEMIREIDNKWALYANDLEMKRAGHEVHNETVEIVQEIQQEAAQEIAANTLIANVESTPVLLAEGKAIQRNLEIVVTETQAWAVRVIVTFIKTPDCHKLTKNRKWSTLDVAQMAAALSKYANTNGITNYEGLEMKEVIK
jgi:hypothetical protein